MVFYFLYASSTPKSLGRIYSQQTLNQIPEGISKDRWDFGRLFPDVLVHLNLVLVVMRWQPNNHFKKQNSQRIVVDRVTIHIAR